MDLSNYIWYEKYRPKTINDVIVPETFYRKFKQFVSDGEIPNLMFEGPPGSGKTTCGLIICSPTGVLSDPNSNMLFVSGSSQSTRGIGFVDRVIKPFIKNPPIGKDKIRIVLIDEGDNMSDAAYSELRSLISGDVLKTARFLLTCNYPSRIPSPVRSRFMSYQFKQLDKDYLLSYCSKILTEEKISFEKQDVVNIIKAVYPDVRKIVSILQDNSFDGKLNISQVRIYEREIIVLFKDIIVSFNNRENSRLNKSWGNMVDIISNNDINYPDLYQKLFKEVSEPYLKIVINSYCNTHPNALVPWMHFQAMVYDCILAIKKFKNISS
jgi:replication factor C small subunit